MRCDVETCSNCGKDKHPDCYYVTLKDLSELADKKVEQEKSFVTSIFAA